MNLSFDDIELDVLDEQFSDAGGDMAGSIVGGIGSLGSIFGQIGSVKKYNKALNDRHAFYEKSKRLIDAKVIKEREARALLKNLNLSKRLNKAKKKGSKKKKTGGRRTSRRDQSRNTRRERTDSIRRHWHE